MTRSTITRRELARLAASLGAVLALGCRASSARKAWRERFADLGGHGFATVRVTPDALEAEFVAIPRPIERIDAPDGGPLAYRVVHRVKRWSPGEPPAMEQQIVEGVPPLATRVATEPPAGSR